jgi:LacI family transcriptional regulator
MRAVARAAAVHQTTVSLALRNDPRLPEATRRRIRRLAEQLGYKPDPMLSALNFYRTSRQAARAPATMGFLLNLRDRKELAASYPHRLFLEGAREHAERIGYQLEAFYLGREAATVDSGRRMERILKARGIAGVILGAFGDKTVEFRMRWAQFSAVLIESQQLGLSLHAVSNHQLMITREAVRRLCGFGYRRIGLAVGEREEVYLRNAFTAGYYVEMAQHPELAPVAPCLLTGRRTAEIASLVDRWARANGVEAIVSNWISIPGLLRLRGWRVPRDLVVASLDLTPGAGPNAGMRQNHRIVGARAVEQLAILMKTSQRGLVDPPNHTLIEGVWVNGTDVPRRRPRRGPDAGSASILQ